MSIFVRWLVLF